LSCKPRTFLTHHVAGLVYKKHKDRIFNEAKQLVASMSSTPACASMIGAFFEAAFHDHIVSEKKFVLKKTNIRIDSSSPVALNAKADAPSVELNVLYLPISVANDTFDSYILNKEGKQIKLYFMQVTLNANHTGGTWLDSVKKVYDAAVNKHSSLAAVQLVYVLPPSRVHLFVLSQMTEIPTALLKKYTSSTIASPFDLTKEQYKQFESAKSPE